MPKVRSIVPSVQNRFNLGSYGNHGKDFSRNLPGLWGAGNRHKPTGGELLAVFALPRGRCPAEWAARTVVKRDGQAEAKAAGQTMTRANEATLARTQGAGAGPSRATHRPAVPYIARFSCTSGM